MSEPNLDEILEEYAAATPAGNDLKVLQVVAEKHPQHADDLTDFAAARAVAKHAPEEELSAEEEQRFAEAGLNNLRMVLGALGESRATPNALDSLVDAAKAKGLNRKGFAAALGLSTSLVMYLEKRRLDFASIPKTTVEKVARVLDIGEELVSSYLNQPPDLATNMSFKTNARAEDLPPKNFSDAVREDQQLSAEEKRKLLELS